MTDPSGTGYGEWYCDVSLAGHANPGDTLSVQWFELYSVTNGHMRLTVLFFNSGNSVVGQTDFIATGQSSGWQGAIAASGFTRRNSQFVVPPNAVKMRASLVSGGPATTTGVMLIDDLSVAPPPPPPLLAGNFWPNPTFESGANLGQPTGWVRAGSNTNLCVVTTDNSSSPTHALAVIDTDESGYGQWDADVLLAGNAAPGDWLDFQWSEMYAATNDIMRVTVLFFDAADNVMGQVDAVASGQSAGWQGSIATSSFTVHKLQLMVPYNAVRLRVSLVSGGSLSTTGVMVIDDLSVARHPYPSTVLSYNFFPNPTFEDGAQMDNPAVALPSGGWQRGGDATIDLVTTNNSTSPRHALTLLDNSTSNYGEWYMFYTLGGVVGDNDAVDIQYYQIYSTTNGNMRLSFAFVDGTGTTLVSQDFNTSGQSQGWTGNPATSPFEKQFQRMQVPPGATRLRVNLASGGSSTVTGLMTIDDLSVRKSLPVITAVTPVTGGYEVTWNSMANKSYTVLYAETLSATTSWTPLVTGLAGSGLTTSFWDTAPHPGAHGFYRVIQE